MELELYERKKFKKEEILELVKTFKNYQIEELEIDNENKTVTPKEEVKDWTKEKPNPFTRIYYFRTTTGRIFFYENYEVSFEFDDYEFKGRIYKLRKETEEEAYYVFDVKARKEIFLDEYNRKDVKIDNLYTPTIIKNNDEPLAKFIIMVNFEDYYFNNIYENENGFYFSYYDEDEYNLDDKKIIANFKNKKLYYCNKEIVAFLTTNNKDFIGIKTDDIKDFLDRNEFYLKTKDENIFYVEKMDTNVERHEEFLESKNIDYKGIFYRCDCLYGNEKSKIITEEKMGSYFDVDILFTREKEKYIKMDEWIF